MNIQIERANPRRVGGNKGRYRVGLALSSGGAKGLSHIGVIQVLEENGIEVDVVAGCSMGAYVAAVWCCGYDGDFMEKLAREVEGPWGLLKLLDPVITPRKGFILGNAMKDRLKKSIGDAHFSDLIRPLRVVATNLDTLDREIFSEGEVAAAVHASSAMPGVCVPVTIDGQAYIDGGVSDPLPVDVLREMGCERIIAVNTIPTPDFLRSCRKMEHEQTEFLRKRHGLLPLLNRRFNYFARGNILDIIMRAFHGAQIRVAEEACRQADVVLRPLTNDGHWHDFNHPGKYIALGRETAEAQLEEIKLLTNGKETFHEPHFAQGEMVAFA